MKQTMKQALALFIAVLLAIPASTCGGALAAALKLPESLTAIEQEAFQGDVTVDSVEIPWGADSIGGRAFANCGTMEVYIPSTVSQIADDAFAGTNATIIATGNSYARRYADEHDLYWVDAGFRWEDYEPSEPVDLSDYLIEESTFPQVSKEGISDAGTLSEIEACNEAVARLNQLIPDYNTQIRDAIEKTEAVRTMFDDSVSDTGEGVSIRYGSYGFSVTGDALEALSTDCTVRSTSFGEDGVLRMELADGSGEPIYAAFGDGGAVVSRQDSNLIVLSKAAQGSSQEVIDTQAIVYADVDEKLQGISLALDAANIFSPEMDRAVDTLKAFYEKHPGIFKLTPKQLRIIQAVQILYPKLADVISKTPAASLPGLGMGSSFAAITTDKQRLLRLQAIRDCGHPTSGEMDDESFRFAMEMMADLHTAEQVLAVDIQINTLRLILDAFTGGKMGVALSRYVAFAKILIDLSNAKESADVSQFYLSVINRHKQLHYDLSGYAKDADTDRVITDVEVSCQAAGHRPITRNTGANAAFTFEPLSDGVTLKLTHEEYEDTTYTLPNGSHHLAPWEPVNVQVEMKPKKGNVVGMVYDEDTRKPIVGARVVFDDAEATTDDKGSFTLDVRVGDYQVRAYKKGYDCDPKEVTVKYKDQTIVELPMRGGYEIWNRDDLEHVNDDLEGTYILCADIDLSDAPWQPLGMFSGSFNGQGYTLSNMQIVATDNSQMGLFTQLQGGTVHDLKLDQCSIQLQGLDYDFSDVGLLAGGAGNGARVDNCVVTHGTIDASWFTGTASVGGMLGSVDGVALRNCRAETVINAASDHTTYGGGLVGHAMNCAANNCDADVNLTMTQGGGGTEEDYFIAYGIASFDSPVEGCDVSGQITVETVNANSMVYGCVYSNRGVNRANLTARSDSGPVYAFGAYKGEDVTNYGEITAFCNRISSANATGLADVVSGTNRGKVFAEGNVTEATALGVSGQHDLRNEAEIRSHTGTGPSNARGIELAQNNATNTGTIIAESDNEFKRAVDAVAIRAAEGEDVGFGCVNEADVTAIIVGEGNGSQWATGLRNCIRGVNNGRINAASPMGGDVKAIALDSCQHSTNYGEVKAETTGDREINEVMAAGIFNGYVCENYGNVTAQTNYTGTATAYGDAGTSYNVNRGIVRAYNMYGDSVAYGSAGDESLNYGKVSAYSENGQAHGHGAVGQHAFNGGEVSAQSTHGWAYAEGVDIGRNGVSTGLVTAMCSESSPQALHSTRTRVISHGETASASDGKGCEVIYISPQSDCPTHKYWAPGYITKIKNNVWCQCMTWCGVAQSVDYGPYVIPDFPLPPQDPTK